MQLMPLPLPSLLTRDAPAIKGFDGVPDGTVSPAGLVGACTRVAEQVIVWPVYGADGVCGSIAVRGAGRVKELNLVRGD